MTSASVWRWLALPLGASVVALAGSTRMLLQPFVWRNFSPDDVVGAWFELALQRLEIALPIAIAATVAWRATPQLPRLRIVVTILAVMIGAVFGEWAHAGERAGSPWSSEQLLHVSIQWGLLAASLLGVQALWQRARAAQRQAIDSELRRARVERQLVDTRVAALRSQIEPHFLFNTLATVRRLHQTERGQGRELLAHFLDYLRATMPDRQRESGTLGDEVELLRAYLAIVALRMSGRLEVVFDIDDDLIEGEMPPFVLATLVENAIKHGIGPSAEGGAIRIEARRVGAALEVAVADTGVGFGGAATGGSGIGLANIRARLATLHGSAASLRLSGNTPRGVRATVSVPWRHGSDRLLKAAA